MAFTQTQLDALRAAYASGATEVSYDGKTVKYRTLAEMARLIGEMEAALGQPQPSRQHYPRFSKGL
jgi:hypothetical protein